MLMVHAPTPSPALVFMLAKAAEMEQASARDYNRAESEVQLGRDLPNARGFALVILPKPVLGMLPFSQPNPRA